MSDKQKVPYFFSFVIFISSFLVFCFFLCLWSATEGLWLNDYLEIINSNLHEILKTLYLNFMILIQMGLDGGGRQSGIYLPGFFIYFRYVGLETSNIYSCFYAIFVDNDKLSYNFTNFTFLENCFPEIEVPWGLVFLKKIIVSF